VKTGIILLTGGVAFLAFALVQIADFGHEGTSGERERVPQSSAPDFCPRYAPSTLPPGFVLRSRAIRNLGNDTMGRSYIYGNGRQTIEIHVGFDALDLYEDLDFVQRAVESGGVERTLHVPGSLGGGGFLGLSWEEPRGRPPCAEITLIARRVDEQTLLSVAAGLRRT
jgi:hypothetical protein